MKFNFSVPLLAVCGSLVVGCTEVPSQASKPAPAPATKAAAAKPPAAKPAASAAQPATTPAAQPAAPVAVAAPSTPVAPPKLSPQAKAVVERLTQAVGPDVLPHELSESSGFPEAIASLQAGAAAPRFDNDGSPQPPPKGLTADGTTTRLVERDWTGLVLVPISTSLSKAYTSEVRLLKIEAHPLSDGRVRIWTRIQNVGKVALPAEVACSFRMQNDGTPSSPYFYQLDVPALSYRDVFFISPDGQLTSYTVLVRSEGMAR